MIDISSPQESPQKFEEDEKDRMIEQYE